MLNSRNYQADSQVLNSGEEIVTDLDEYKDPNAKTYYHMVKGAITHLPDGAQITFQGGQFVTANPEIQNYLNKIANKRGSMVYTKQEAADAANLVTKEAALAAMVAPGNQGKPNEAGGVENKDVTKMVDESKLIAETDKTAGVLVPAKK